MSTNPYQTPEGQLSTDDQSFGEVKFFSPSSRVNRLRYWAHGALLALAAYAILAIGGALSYFVSPWAGIPVMVVAYIAMLVFSVIIMIQRLHDLNKTGWMWLLALVPFANIYLMIILIFFKGTPGRNNYGLQTPPNKTWHWVLALGFPALMLVVIFAVALPAYNQKLQTMQAAQSYQFEEQTQDTYPSEYTEESTTDESLYTDEAIVDGLPVDEEITDEPVEDSTESETPQ